MAYDRCELRDLPQLERLEERFDFPLVVVRTLPVCPAPRFFHHFPLANVFGSNYGGILIRGGENQFVAQI